MKEICIHGKQAKCNNYCKNCSHWCGFHEYIENKWYCLICNPYYDEKQIIKSDIKCNKWENK